MVEVIKFQALPRSPEEAPPKGFRKTIPLEVKIKVLLLQGHIFDEDGNIVADVGVIEWDHCPALQERRFDRKAWDTTPPADDPHFIVARVKSGHKAKTKRLTAAQSAVRNRGGAKSEPDVASELEAALQESVKTPLGRKILSRSFPKSDKQKACEQRRKEREQAFDNE